MNQKKIGFIGFGLIGGSIAKKLKDLDPNLEIIAMAHSKRTIEIAFTEGILPSKQPAELSDFKDCSLIFLCAPVEANINYIKELKDIVSRDCILTDVGSTKQKTHETISALGLEDIFIGGHPMTGSEKTGIENASAALLENAYYILTPTEKTPVEKLETMKELVKDLGSIPLVLDYKEHDRATAAISHLPHMIAFSLVHMVENQDNQAETMKTIAAGSFRDMTRVAASSPTMWESITSSNKGPILEMMDLYMREFENLKASIENYDSDKLMDYFSDAKEFRDSLNLPSRHLQNMVQEIYLDLNDEAGQIAIIATILAFRGINIKNIGIINNREFEQGVLRIEFYDANAKETAIELLKERNYTVYIR